MHLSLNRFVIIFVSFCILLISFGTKSSAIGPFPVKGEIFDNKKQLIGEAHVFPRYIEIFNTDEKLLGKVGILVEDGLAKLFLVRADNSWSLVGYASKGNLFGADNKLKGKYFWTPTWSFIYNTNNNKVGEVKCIAWPRICSAGVAGYLLKLFEFEKNEK